MANQIINLNGSVPAIPSGKTGVVFQSDYGTPTANTSAYVNVPAGSDTQVQVNSAGALYADARFNYLNGLGAPATFSPVVTQHGSAGSTTYYYNIVAKNGNAEISIGYATTTTGNATLSGSNYNIITWTAVTGATSYDIYRQNATTNLGGFLTNVVSLLYDDTGAALASNFGLGPVYPENGFATLYTGLLVQNGSYQTLQSHFGESIGLLNNIQFEASFPGQSAQTAQFGRNEFVTVGPGRLVDTVNMPVVSILCSDGPNYGLYVSNTINTNLGSSGADVTGIFGILNGNNITDTDFGSAIGGNAYLFDSNITGFSDDYDHGTVAGGKFGVDAVSLNVNAHYDCVLGVLGSVNPQCNNSKTMSITHLIGVAGQLSVFGSGSTAPTVTNGYSFKGSVMTNGGAFPMALTNFYQFFADNPSRGTPQITITNSYGFYAKSQVPAGGIGTLTAAFYAEDQANAAGSWAVYTAGTTPSKFGGSVTSATNILTASTPTTSAGQVGFGTTTATSASAGSNGAVPLQVVGYLEIDIAGTKYKIPYYAV